MNDNQQIVEIKLNYFRRSDDTVNWVIENSGFISEIFRTPQHLG